MSDEIDRLSRRRRIVLGLHSILFLGLQSVLFGRLDRPVAMWRAVDWVTAAGFLAWSASLIYVLATGVFLIRGRSPEVRAALNDELTAANRAIAYRTAYWMVTATIFVMYVLSQFFELTLAEALRILFAFSVAMPAAAFAGRERKQGA